MQRLVFFLCVVLILACSGKPRFRLLTSENTGIEFINSVISTDSFNVLDYEYIYNGAGVGIADLNNDGYQDVILIGNQVSPRIYLNQGKFRFKDITASFKGLTNNHWFSGVAVADINNDLWPDVYFTTAAGNDSSNRRNQLWINQGSGTGKDPVFIEKADDFGIAQGGRSVHAAFFDYDLDGDLDLYVLNNYYVQNKVFNVHVPSRYRQSIIDGTAPNNDRLFRNNGNGKFTDVTLEAGIVYEGCGLGLALGDVNKDGYPDVYISNDYLSNDLLYINQGNGTFRNQISKYLSYQTKSSMGNDMADVNNDGCPDIYTMDMLPVSYARKKQTINGFSYAYYINDEQYNFEHQYLRNMMHIHNGFIDREMIPYSEVGQMMGIYHTEWSWSPLFADYDNDGDNDLIITNGYPVDLTDKDWTFYKMKTYGIYASANEVIRRAPHVKVINVAFENTGEISCWNKTSNWLPQIPSYSNGAAFVDLDNDGDLDYVINNVNDKAFVYRNSTCERSKTKSNYIRIRLKGKQGNTMALGAKIELWSGKNYQYKENFLSRGYASSVDPVIHFGLSDTDIIDSLKVSWPASGYISMVKDISVNQTINLDEEQSVPSVSILKSLPGNRLFVKQDDLLLYTHEQNDFYDFFGNQPIIPHKFSQIGPAMAQGDLDSDGQHDLIIGATNKLPTTVLLRKGNGFTKAEFPGLTTPRGFSESDLAIVDIDGDGDRDVVAIAGGYENNDEKEYQHFLYENRNGSFSKTPLPIPAFPASVVRPFDFDHDGDIDLFIGARIKKGMFPYSNHSWLVINEKGKLSATDASKLNLGMVTDAIWTDYDKDGWEDLLVARECNSLVILKNMQGKELVPQDIPALEDQHGLWYGLAAGDFDQDGDDDYIAGNLGDNHRFTVSDQYPMQLYAVDLDNDGNIDPLTTAYWKDQSNEMQEYPINYFDELHGQSQLFKKKFQNYTDFSYATIQDILDGNIMKRLGMKLYVNTTSSYIIWNDKSNLRWEKLPGTLQVSPVKKMIVRDFNGDKYPDVLLAGNDYTYDVATGYYDANKGIVLLNQGKGQQGFDLLTPSKSGILLQGMVESLQYFEGDTALIVAGINRNKALVYKLIEP